MKLGPIGFVFGAIILLLPSFTEAKTSKEPIEHFIKRSQYQDIRISPTGKYLAVKGYYKEKSQITILDRKTLKPLSSLHFSKQKNQEIGDFGWLNEERIYAQMNVRVGSIGEPYATGYLYASNWDRSKVRLVLPAKGRGNRGRENPHPFEILSKLPEDPEHILISEPKWGKYSSNIEIYKLNIYNGTKRKVDTSPSKNGGLFADEKGNIRIAVEQTNLSTKTKVHYRADIASEWQVLAHYNNEEGGITPLGYSAEKNKIYVYYDGKRRDKGVYLLTPKTMEMSLKMKIIDDFEVTGMLLSTKPNSKEIIGIYREEEIPRSYFLNSDSLQAQLHPGFSATFPGQDVQIISHTKDENLAIIFVSSDKNPGSFYVYNRQKNQINRLAHSKPWIAPDKMHSMQAIQFKARDGLEIKGYLTMPEGKKENLPMVVLVHGGPYGIRDYWGFDPEVQFLASRGYAVLQVNYRGSGGRGNDFHFSHYRKMGAEMQNDLTDGTLWAIKQGIADKNRICIYGASYGGYASLMGVTKEPDLYQCAIGYAGVYDIDIMKKSDTWDRESGQLFLNNAWGINSPQFVKERSPVYHVNKIKADLLLVHGGQDKRCPIEHFEALTNALDKINYPYESLIEPLEVHGFVKPENRERFYSKIEQFLDKHIGPKSLETNKKIQ